MGEKTLEVESLESVARRIIQLDRAPCLLICFQGEVTLSEIERSNVGFRTIGDVAKQKKGTHGVHLLRFIRVARFKACTNSPDRVYGVLGLAEDSYKDLITVDYVISPVEVYG